MALDIGTKRTGIAVSDPSRTISLPVKQIEPGSRDEWINLIKEMIEEYEIGEILVGLPLNQHGEEGRDADNIRKFIALLRARVSTPVIEWDERFTTVQAERTLLEGDLSRRRRKEVIDKIAATILLQSYLDSRRFNAEQESWQNPETD